MHLLEGKDGLDRVSGPFRADFHKQVSSTVATLKIDNPIPEYYDNAAASRIQCRMVSQGPSQYMTTHSPSTINYDSYQYRNNSVSSYQQYPGKQYYSGASPFAEYDENVDYGLQTSYQLMAPDHIQATSPNSNYGTTGQLRGWTPGPQLPKSNSLFLEQEQPQYGHGQLPYNNAGNFPMRTSMGTDTKGMGLSAMPILPTPVSGNDRVLPNPTANRPAQMNAFLVRNNDGMVPMAQQTYQPFGNYMATNMLNNVKGSNHTAVSENAYSMPMASASPESISSSQIYTGSENSVSLSQHQSEIYSPNDGLHYHTSEPSESSYGHSNSSRRESHSSRTTQHEGSLPSHSEGELSNGHHYVPYQHLSANYPTPPMNIPPPAVLHPRSSLQPVQ